MKRENITSDMHIVSNQIFNLINTPIEQNFERLGRMTKRMFNIPMMAISLFDEKRQLVKPIVTLDLGKLDLDMGIFNEFNLDDVLVVEDTTKDDRFKDHKLVTEDPLIRFIVSCPIFEKNGKKVGSLIMLDSKPRTFGLSDLMNLNDIIKLIEKEISDFRLSKAQKMLLQEISNKDRTLYIDAQTRAWNYEGFKKILQYQINDSQKEKFYFALAVIDIDNLTEINEKYGKDTGDEVLTLTSRTISRSCRDEDTIARGDEEDFVVIIHASKLEHVQAVVNRIQANIAMEQLKSPHSDLKFHVTIGVTFFKEQINTAETLLQNGKISLLKGKRLGRNCIEFS